MTVIKHVINDDVGTAVAGDFSISLNDGETPPFSGDEGGTLFEFQIPHSFNVTETELAGYAVSYSVDCTGVIEADVPKTCTITNDDMAPTLTLWKTVINDSGGTATKTDFQGYINGLPVSWGVPHALIAGNYTASEIMNVSGYTASDWSGDCLSGGSVSLAVGDDKNCYITNDDQHAYITVVKEVINDNGGSALPDDFLLTLDGSPVSSGVAVAVNPGTYGADKTLLSGYTFVGYSGECNVDGDTTVALGESKTCTLTNDDDAPSLTLVKEVINDNGGTATAADFQASVCGTDVDWGVFVGFNAGSYDADEVGPAGYIASDWTGDCAPGGAVTLAVGDEKTCDITNIDVPSHCTYTQGYWKTHSIYGPAGPADPAWYLVDFDGNTVFDGPDEMIFGSGFTALEVLNEPPKGGNAWFILGKQWIAAMLSYANGSWMAGMAETLDEAAVLLGAYDGPPPGIDKKLNPGDRAEAIWLAGYLAAYNEGLIGPGHCD